MCTVFGNVHTLFGLFDMNLIFDSVHCARRTVISYLLEKTALFYGTMSGKSKKGK